MRDGAWQRTLAHMDRHGKRADVIVHEWEPFNAETGLAALAEAPVTATDAFYVRGHGAVPALDPAAWRLRVHGLVERELELSLPTLREAFREREVTATLQCAGNRRAGLIAIRDIPGEAPWGPGATGTATWAGVPLTDVLALAGLAARGRPRRLRRRRHVPGGQAGPALRRLDPARQGVPPGGPARMVDERRAAQPRPRRAAARGRPGLHRRPQREVARADRGARGAVEGLLPARRLPAAPRGRHAGPGRWDAARAGRVERRHPRAARTARRSPRARSRSAGTRSPAASATSPASTSRSTAARAGRRRSCSTTSAAGPGGTGGSSSTSRPASTSCWCARGTRRRRPSPRTRPPSGTRRATSTTPARGSGSARPEGQSATSTRSGAHGSRPRARRSSARRSRSSGSPSSGA